MRITAVEPIPVDVPLREPVQGVHGTTAVQRSVLVRIEAEAGVEGWGNVDPTPGYSAVSAEGVHATIRGLAPAVIGADPFNLHAAVARMDRAMAEACEAKAAVEMALVDLKARALGLSVHDLLGGRVKDAVTLDEALTFIPRLEGFGRTLVEQPTARHDIAGLARIRRASNIPLMADESVSDPAALVRIIRLEAADLVKLKVMKQGGMLRTLAMVECAAAAGLKVVLGHGFGLTLSTLAEAAVAAVSEAVIDGCEAVGPLKMAGDVVGEPVRLDAGVIALSDEPGLGATVDPASIKRYRVDL